MARPGGGFCFLEAHPDPPGNNAQCDGPAPASGSSSSFLAQLKALDELGPRSFLCWLTRA